MKKLIAGMFIMAGSLVYCGENREIYDAFKNDEIYYFDVEEGLKTRVKIDLNGDDRRDNLSFFVDERRGNEYVEIRVEEREQNIEKKGEIVKSFFIMDSDKKDNFVEFGVIYTKENGMNPSVNIYRYNKKKKIERVNKKPLNFKMIGISGDGKVYFKEGMIYRTDSYKIDENSVLRYYDVEDDKIVEKKIKDRERRYENDWEMVVYKDEEDIIEKEPITEEEKIDIAEREKILVGILRKWDKFEILKVVKGTDHVKIKMYDGKTGWIGGNHMVWEEKE